MTLFAVIRPILVMILAAWWVACIVDALRQHRSWLWVLGLVFVPIVSAPVYFLNFKLGGSNKGHIDAKMNLLKRLRDLQAELAVRDVPALRRDIAGVYYELGRWREALESLRPVLDDDPEDLAAQFQAGMCWVRLGQAEAAANHLEYVVDEEPKYARGEARVALGNVWKEMGRDEDAVEQFARAAQEYSIPEAVVRHARFLRERGERDAARRALLQMLKGAGDLDPDLKRKSRKWIRAAAEDLKSLESDG